jgi:hypothetical protein
VNADFAWRDLAPIAVIGTALSGLVMLLIRASISRDFARRADVSDLSGRLGELESAVRASPSHADIRAITDRVASVETSVGVANAQISGVREDVRGVQHDLRLLLTHMMAREPEK